MQTFFSSVWWLIVSLGILVTFHEFGHFWVARRAGVRVLTFSIGFGRPLWIRRGHDGIQWQIAAIPLGGYVRMLDEREQEVADADLPYAFNRKPIGWRIAIVAAGPLFNLLLCVALLWLMFVLGKSDYAPIVGRSEGIAASAGFEAGDRLLAIDGEPTATWTDAGMRLAEYATTRTPVQVRVARADGSELQRRLDLAALPADLEPARLLASIGLIPRHHLRPPIVGDLGEREQDSPSAGILKPGDRILRIGDRRIEEWKQISEAVQAQAAVNRPLSMLIERDGGRLDVSIQPRIDNTRGSPTWIIGIRPAPIEPDTVVRRSPLAALGASVDETWRMARSTVSMLAHLVSGRAALENLSGPIGIARFANESAQLGLSWFLHFLALMSLSLCILNLLPIPILDGGHLLYYLIELIKGGPLSERAMMTGQYIGLVLLAGLMGLAFYSDISKLFG